MVNMSFCCCSEEYKSSYYLELYNAATDVSDWLIDWFDPLLLLTLSKKSLENQVLNFGTETFIKESEH